MSRPNTLIKNWKATIKLTPKEKFSLEVEKIAILPDVSYMDAVVIRAKLAEIDLEKISPLLTKKIKEKIKEEAMSLNLLKENS